MHKAYVALTTCATSRMLHLELVTDLSTPSYVRSQIRMMARRGYPKMFVSDNGKTFKGSQLRRFNTKNGIRWRFNLAKSPWWGGMFERLVQSVKRCLKKSISNKKLNYEELLTILIEVEMVLNNRPLTYIDEEERCQPLTPSHLFHGRRILTTNAVDEEVKNVENINREEAVSCIKKINDSLHHFWKRWLHEYLINLRESHKLRGAAADIQVGDIVIIHEEGVKRHKWKIGKVEKLIKGNDDIVRGAVLKYNKGDREQEISRPLQLLYPMEINKRHELSGIKRIPSDTTGNNDEGINAEDYSNIDIDNESHIKRQGCPDKDEVGVNDGFEESYEVEDNIDEIDRLLTDKKQLKSKRVAAVDGQLRRRILKQI